MLLSKKNYKLSFLATQDKSAKTIVINDVPTNKVIRDDGTLLCRGSPMGNKKRVRGTICNGVTVNKKKYYLFRHILVAKAFVVNPRPDIFTNVSHIDGNLLNNKAANLIFLSTRLITLRRKTIDLQECKEKTWRGTVWKSSIKFCGNEFTLGSWTDKDALIETANKLRQALFDKIYWYRTRPNTYNMVENWVVRECVIHTNAIPSKEWRERNKNGECMLNIVSYYEKES